LKQKQIATNRNERQVIMGRSRTQNPNHSHNNPSQRIGTSPQRKTTRSTGNATNVEKNQVLAGMGHKRTAHVVSETEDTE
jgi:hypothetical protein